MASNNNDKPIPTNPAADAVPKGITLPTRWVKVSHLSAVEIAARYPYAAYGSNLDLAQMARRCPSADIVAKGVIPDARLVFAYYCGIVADKKSDVPVGVYRLQPADVIALDRYEGLSRRNYERYLVTVMCDQVAVRCMTYIKTDNRLEKPSDRYYDTVAQGYRDWQIDDRRLRHARTKAIKEGKGWREPTVKPASKPVAYEDYEPMGGNGSYYGPFDGAYGAGGWQNKDYQRMANMGAPGTGNQQRLPFHRGVEHVKSLVTGRLLSTRSHESERRIDERLSVEEFRRRVGQTKPNSGTHAMGNVDDPARVSRLNGSDQNEFTNANGERWIKDKNNVWRRAKD
jgi:hypothetical protein